jgi:agmatinase
MTIRPPAETFLGAPFASPADLAASGASPGARFAFLGLPLYVRYGDEPPAAPPGSPTAVDTPAEGPAGAVRRAGAAYAAVPDHYDFDLGGPLVPPGVAGGFVDCGDVELSGAPRDLAADLAAGTAAVGGVVAAGAVPLVVGGDHSAPPVVVRGLPDDRPLDVLHVDAHLDFRDEVAGLRDGYSSPIRRLRELPHVRSVVQVGLRDVGSARAAEVEAARAAGNLLVLAEEVHERGAALLDELVARFDPEHRVYITVDVDGLDPSCAPGALWPAPGGLWFWQLARLVRGVAGRCELAGMDVCEFVPERDPQGLTALAAARLFMIAAGASLRRSS